MLFTNKFSFLFVKLIRLGLENVKKLSNQCEVYKLSVNSYKHYYFLSKDKQNEYKKHYCVFWESLYIFNTDEASSFSTFTFKYEEG